MTRAKLFITVSDNTAPEDSRSALHELTQTEKLTICADEYGRSYGNDAEHTDKNENRRYDICQGDQRSMRQLE